MSTSEDLTKQVEKQMNGGVTIIGEFNILLFHFISSTHLLFLKKKI